MDRFKKTLKKLWQDESGQGAMEYILILVVVGVLVIAFREKIVEIIKGRSDQMGGRLQDAIKNI